MAQPSASQPEITPQSHKNSNVLEELMKGSSKHSLVAARDMRRLIQELVETKVEPMEFCDRVKRLFNVPWRTCLPPSLKIILPRLCQQIKTKEIVIYGIWAPGTTGLYNQYTTDVHQTLQEKMTGQELQALKTDILEFLECLVCKMIPKKLLVTQCAVGHVVCFKCSQKLKSCPLCRSKFLLSTPPEFYNMVLTALPLCMYPGCLKLVKINDQHEQFCGFRLWECQWCAKLTVTGCDLQQNFNNFVSGHDLLDHTRKQHGAQLITDNETADFTLEACRVAHTVAHTARNNTMRKSFTKFIDNNLYQVEYMFRDAFSDLDISCHVVGNEATPLNKTFCGTVELSTDEGTHISFSKDFQGNALNISFDECTLNEFVAKTNLTFGTIFKTNTKPHPESSPETDQHSFQEVTSTRKCSEEEKLGNADIITLVVTLLSCVKCPICDIIPRVGNIVQCVKGHVFCYTCSISLESCKICTSAFTVQTPLIFSQLLDLLPKFCINKDCHHLILKGDPHDIWCGFKTVQCWWCDDYRLIKSHDMLRHLQENHSAELITSNSSVDFILPDLKEINEINKKKAKYVFGNLFLLRYSFFVKRFRVDFTLISNGQIPVEKSISIAIDISDGRGNCYSLSKEVSLNVEDCNLVSREVTLTVCEKTLKQLSNSNLQVRTTIITGENNIHKRKQSVSPVEEHDGSKKLKTKYLRRH